MKNLSCLMIFITAITLTTGCAQENRDPRVSSASESHYLSHTQRSNSHTSINTSQEVVRYDRYLLVNTSPTFAQRQPLEQIVDITIPITASPTVGDAMHYLLKQTGFSLCSKPSIGVVLYNKPLPAIHHNLGPIRLHEALQILAGVAWKLELDVVQRTLCYSLKEGFSFPAAPSHFTSNKPVTMRWFK